MGTAAIVAFHLSLAARIRGTILMRKPWLLPSLAMFLMSAPAEESLPPGFDQWTNASLKSFAAKMHEDAAHDPHHFSVEQLADYPHDSSLWVHREGDGAVEWHKTQADVFFVQSGSATLLVGGTMVNAETVGPDEKRNGCIRGGTRIKLSPGDVVRIPPRVPHQVLLEGSHEFDYLVIKIKNY